MNKARIASSNKTGLVYKISIALMLLLGFLLYKLNDYFKNDKTYVMQDQIRKGVVTVKTSVSGQLSQLKNSLSSYEGELSEASVNWVQLDPFFVIANVENISNQLKVSKLVARSNTPAERWNAAYLEAALKINKSSDASPILAQLFKDHVGAKFILLRFIVAPNKEIVLATNADYFQKYFDIQRGSRNKSLLITTENILAAHTEGDYIATSSKEAKLPPSKYITEKEEILGTNLVAVSYILKSKITSGFAVPWSIVSAVLGFGFILIGILFYSLEPIEKRVERYKKQEREQIYKDTVKQSSEELAQSTGFSSSRDADEPTVGTIKKSINLGNPNFSTNDPDKSLNQDNEFTQTKTLPMFKDYKDVPSIDLVENETPVKKTEPEIINLLERATPFKEATVFKRKEDVVNIEKENLKTSLNLDPKADLKLNEEAFVTLDEEKIDLDEIEKALALDDFDSEKPNLNFNAETLQNNLKPQKVSLSSSGSTVEKPKFTFEKKEFKVDNVKINIRRPERS